MIYFLQVTSTSHKHLKLLGVPEMLESGHIFHEDVQALTPFLDEYRLGIADKLFGR